MLARIIIMLSSGMKLSSSCIRCSCFFFLFLLDSSWFEETNMGGCERKTSAGRTTSVTHCLEVFEVLHRIFVFVFIFLWLHTIECRGSTASL